jgi:hypothetical protein
MAISGEARAEARGASKYYSDTVHYCSALLHEGILVFLGAFAPPQRERSFTSDGHVVSGCLVPH